MVLGYNTEVEKVYLTQVTNTALPFTNTGGGFFAGFLPALINFFFVLGIVLFVFMFLIGAVQYTSSGGEKHTLEYARVKITNAVIGLVLLLSIYGVIKTLSCFFGVNPLEINIGPYEFSFGTPSFC